MIDPRPAGRAPNARYGRCADCRNPRFVFELDGTAMALCEDCVRGQIELVAELMATRELYEGSSVLDWLEAHRSDRGGAVGCPWCGAGSVS